MNGNNLAERAARPFVFRRPANLQFPDDVPPVEDGSDVLVTVTGGGVRSLHNIQEGDEWHDLG